MIEKFKKEAIFRMDENLPRIRICLNKLTEDQVWTKPNSTTNSIGNLVLHLCGNITQYIQSSLGGAKDERVRSVEFVAHKTLNKEALYLKIEQVVKSANEVIQKLPLEDLEEVRYVQGFEMSGVGNIIHVVEHFSYHTGQIAFLTKMLVDEDLGFYADMDLDVHNQ